MLIRLLGPHHGMLLHGWAVSTSETPQLLELIVGQHLRSAKHGVARGVWHIVTCASHREALWVVHVTLLMLVKLVSHGHML